MEGGSFQASDASSSRTTIASLAHRWILTTSLLFTAGAAIVVAGLGVWIAISGAPQVRGVEINVILTLQKHMMGWPLYTDPGNVPFDVAQYGPLYYLICATLARILGVGGDDPAGLLLLCRTFSLLCATLIVAGCFYFARKTLRLPTSISFVCAAFTLVATSPWFFLARPDALMSLAMLASFAFAVKSASQRGVLPAHAYLLLAVCLGLASACAKQTGAQSIIIVLLYFLFIRQFWKCMSGLVATAVLGSVSYFILVHAYPHLLANVVGGVNNGINLQKAFGRTYGPIFSSYAFVLAMSLLAVIRWASIRTDPRHAFFVVSLPVLFAIAVVTGAKDGAGVQYFDEFLIVATLATGCLVQSGDRTGVPRNVSRGQSSMLVSLVAAYLICFLPYWTLAQGVQYWWHSITPKKSLILPEDSLWSADHYSVGQRLRAELASDPEAMVLSFNLALNSFIPERCVVPQKEVASLLYDRGIVDYSLFRQFVEEGRVRYVVVDASSSPPDTFLGANISDRYVLAYRVHGWAVYRWRHP